MMAPQPQPTEMASAEEVRRAAILEDKKTRRAARRARKAGQQPQRETKLKAKESQLISQQASLSLSSPAVPATPVAFVFPGQGSQALGMLQVSQAILLLQTPTL